MRAPTPQLSLTSSVPLSKKPPLKKRKLSHNQSSTRQDTDSSCPLRTEQGSRASPGITALHPHKPSTLSCSSCHRVLSASMRHGTGAGAGVTCARCGSPLCTVCTRTCSSMIRPPSFPPTPALTRSPSPSVSSSGSPKRVALSLSISAINCDLHFSPSSKRKKSLEKDDVDADHPSKFRDTFLGLDDAALASGCGRSICKTCCVESVQNDGTLCVDCYAVL